MSCSVGGPGGVLFLGRGLIFGSGSYFWVGGLFLGWGLIFTLPPLQTNSMVDMLDGLLLQADDRDDNDDEGSVDDDSDFFKKC